MERREHSLTAALRATSPSLLASCPFNVSFLALLARAILPYTQALAKVAAVSSAGCDAEQRQRAISIDAQARSTTLVPIRPRWRGERRSLRTFPGASLRPGSLAFNPDTPRRLSTPLLTPFNSRPLPYDTGEIDFGEPGTNGQHSFYQLIHQGRTIPCDFIGIIKSQQSVYLKGEIVSNHDELMCNFFAQADALAVGKTDVELRSENVPTFLIPHKTFTGNRPSLSIMLPALNAYSTGQLLAIYEHRVAVQGFVWGLNSFDQWGVELGKVLASKVRVSMSQKRTTGELEGSSDGFNSSTTAMLNRYLKGKAQLKYAEAEDVFPCDLIDSDEVPAADVLRLSGRVTRAPARGLV